MVPRVSKESKIGVGNETPNYRIAAGHRIAAPSPGCMVTVADPDRRNTHGAASDAETGRFSGPAARRVSSQVHSIEGWAEAHASISARYGKGMRARCPQTEQPRASQHAP